MTSSDQFMTSFFQLVILYPYIPHTLTRPMYSMTSYNAKYACVRAHERSFPQ